MLLLIATAALIFLLLGHVPGVQILWLPVLTLLALALGMGTGLVLGISNVFLRDVGRMYLLPCNFMSVHASGLYGTYYFGIHHRQWSSLTHVCHRRVYHNILVFNQPPALLGLVLVSLLTVLLLALAFVACKASPEMVDML